MNIEIALRTVLVDAPAVAALVDTRVYPMVLPQDPTYPAITYQTITGSSEYSMEGPSNLAAPRMQLDLYAGTAGALFDLRGAVMKALSGFAGAVGSPPVKIYGAFKQMEIDRYEQDLEQAGPRVWHKTLDFQLWFKEAY